MERLGFCYENGIGVEADCSAALEWYDRAAEQGDEDAEEAAERLRKKIRA